MSKQEALDIVMDLATQNMVDKDENPEEYERQATALDICLELKQGLDG